jgi:hypothetical protein
MPPLRRSHLALLLAVAGGSSLPVTAIAAPVDATRERPSRFSVNASVLPAAAAPAARYSMRDERVEPGAYAATTQRYSLAGGNSKGAVACAGTGTDAIFRNGFEN